MWHEKLYINSYFMMISFLVLLQIGFICNH